MQFRTTATAKVGSVSCCLRFDPMDGQIRHTHRIVTIEGAPDTPKGELESQTLKLARDLGLDTARLRSCMWTRKRCASRATTRSIPHRSIS